MRVSSNVRVIPEARSPAQARDLLERLRAVTGHEFWSDDVSPVDPDAAPFRRVVGYRQVTHAHLLTLAFRRGGVVATFDRGVEELADGEQGVVEIIQRNAPEV